MSVDHRGTELNDDSMTILQTIARQSRDDEQGDDDEDQEDEKVESEATQDERIEFTADGATTSLMKERTGLASGSVHHYLRENLEPANLIEITDTEPQAGAAPDRHIWTLTDYGKEWLESLTADDYSPAVASEKALEISSEARRHARAARNDIREAVNREKGLADAIEETSDRLNARLNQQATQIEEAEKNIDTASERLDRTPDREAVNEEITDLARKMDDLKTIAGKPDQDLVSEINDIDAKLTGYNQRISQNNALIRGWDSDANDDGLRGDIKNISKNLEKAETHIDDFALLAVAAGLVSVLALLVALVAGLFAVGLL